MQEQNIVRRVLRTSGVVFESSREACCGTQEVAGQSPCLDVSQVARHSDHGQQPATGGRIKVVEKRTFWVWARVGVV